LGILREEAQEYTVLSIKKTLTDQSRRVFGNADKRRPSAESKPNIKFTSLSGSIPRNDRHSEVEGETRRRHEIVQDYFEQFAAEVSVERRM
jgi:hypothetical protein